MNDHVKGYFNLSNNEQRGIISLVLLILFVFIIPRVYILTLPAVEIPEDNTHLLAHFTPSSMDNPIPESRQEKTLPQLFPFDPNTASKEDLILLGIKKSVVTILINYRSKGGRFQVPEDLLTVYGISPEQYDELADYIQIEAKHMSKSTWKARIYDDSKPTYDLVEKSTTEDYIKIELNSADSSRLTKVKGIGPVYASRIIKYRKLLGGFKNIKQLQEVYGIDEEVYLTISDQLILSAKIIPLKVHTASWYELKSHPYISGDLANIILNYIKAHGQISNLNDFRDNQLIDEETILKITPYLSFEK